MLGTFALGMTGNVVTGLISQFTEEFHISVSHAGLPLSIYAIGVALFGPILRIVTLKYPPKPLMFVFMLVFVLSHIIAATARSFDVLIISRILASSMHAPYFGLSMMIAFNLSDPQRGSRSMALVQTGLSIAVMIGVPFGSLIGGMLDWRLVFWIITILGLVNVIGIALYLPDTKPSDTPLIRKELKILRNKDVLMISSVILFGFSGVFSTYAFIEPMLRKVSNFGITGVSIGLFFFGLGGVIGNILSGKIKSNSLTQGLFFALGSLSIVLLLFTTLLQFFISALVMCFLLGAGTFGITPIFNAKIVMAAREAPLLSGTLAASVFNLASFIGATLGSLLLSIGFSYSHMTFVSSGLLALGMILTKITSVFEDKTLFQEELESTSIVDSSS
ncbi:MFS transporter [Rossellomorea sp. NPDC077527]|uniref:MFS transporter n=1 Tax=Rossellomorea sp. NPDC077527 TaxID=3364510 RepID=UPI0037C6BAE9